MLNDSPHSIPILARRFVGSNSPVSAARSRRAPPSTLALPGGTPEATNLLARQAALVTCIEVVVRLTQCAVLCPASDRGCVAETTISRLLACIEPAWTAWAAKDRPGAAPAHQADVAGQSNVGLTADRLGAKIAEHQCRKIYGRAVQTQATQTALPQLANFSRAACPRTGLYRLLRRAYRQIEGPVCIGRLDSRPAPDCPFQCHRASNRSMDRTATY